MLRTQPKIALAAALAVGILGPLTDWLTDQARAEPPTDKATKKAEKNLTEVRGVVNAVDASQNTISVTISRKGEPTVERTFAVANSAQVAIDDGKPRDKTKPAPSQRVADLPIGAQVTLRLEPDGQSVVAVWAEGATVHGTVEAVDAAKNTLTLFDKVQGKKTYRVLQDAVVFFDDTNEAKTLVDLRAEAVADVKLLADQKTVREIRAYGPTLSGTVVGPVDKDRITLRNKEGDHTFPVAADTRILLDDDAAGKLSDLIDGTVAQLRLSVDKAKVLDLRAEGPSFQGTVKAVDPARLTIILTIGAKGGVGGEDQEFKVTKQTAVVKEIYHVVLNLADLKADREVILRLTLDQKAAARITLLGE
jgi:hypothetical protein